MADQANSRDQAKLSEDLESLRADLRQLRADMGHLAQDLMQATRGRVDDARHRVGEAVGERMHQFNTMTSDAADWSRQTFATVQEQIEKRPVTCAAVALAAGLLLGKLLLPSTKHRR